MFMPMAMIGQVKVIQVNSLWNRQNDLKLNLKDCQYQFALLEDLSDNIKGQIKSVPFLYVIKDGHIVRQYQGGLRMRLNVTEAELQAYINQLNNGQ
jgi:hypothetical protein